jgi:hypothetical protein
MATVNDKELEDLIGKCSAWLPKAMEQVGCFAPVLLLQLTDRSRIVIVFGLSEKKEEDVEEEVHELFQEIRLKPSLQPCRVGRITTGKSKRPVKVSLFSSSAVH